MIASDGALDSDAGGKIELRAPGVERERRSGEAAGYTDYPVHDELQRV
jgi:hypothetical protein